MAATYGELRRPARAPFDTSRRDVVVVGGGILGLAVAHELVRRRPGLALTLVEKEDSLATHQTAHSVSSTRLYYQPGSSRPAGHGRRPVADRVRAGARRPARGLREAGGGEQPGRGQRLERLCDRGLENGVPVTWLSALEAAEVEPHVSCVAALRVAHRHRGLRRSVWRTGRSERVHRRRDRDRRCRDRVRPEPGLACRPPTGSAHRLPGDLRQAAERPDRPRRRRPGARIAPFRGEYYEPRPPPDPPGARSDLPRAQPRVPFLGVHPLTRMIGGGVHAGPNAVLALARRATAGRT
ncbi:MAG: FAD-dependent oxidoreductase [Nocardioides sp.]